MRQLTFVGPRKLEWWDVPTPNLETGEDALVRATTIARCDLDLYIATGIVPFKPPFSLGHEMVVEVLDVGDRVSRVAPGDRAIVSFQIHCGSCSACQRGRTNSCTSVPPGANFGLGVYGGIDFGGGFSDAVRVPYADAMMLPLPAEVDDLAAAHFSDNAADGYRTVAPHLEDEPGAPVLVVGGLGQSVGLYAAQAAVALGASRVVYTDSDPERLALAKGFGAETRQVSYDEPLEAEETFPITVDANTLPNGRSFAIASTAPNGVCTSISNGGVAHGELPLASMYKKGIRYEIGRVQSRPVMETILGHVCRGELAPEKVVTQTARFADAAEAMLEPATKLVFIRE
ncbi:MAG: alcohol dehydrogenase catalytic domain-containing protein [Myxococcota bacterium]|nr:alcohol dehydrogenase catalytic domain-containing protein [Myxococcota bacterium]